MTLILHHLHLHILCWWLPMLPFRRTNTITFIWFRYLFHICQKILANVCEGTFNYTICLLKVISLEQAVDWGSALLHSVFLSSQCVYVCLPNFFSVPFVKSQVWDLKYSRAAVLLPLTHRTRVRELALYRKYVWWPHSLPGVCYHGTEIKKPLGCHPI